jgi:hypothetical protein
MSKFKVGDRVQIPKKRLDTWRTNETNEEAIDWYGGVHTVVAIRAYEGVELDFKYFTDPTTNVVLFPEELEYAPILKELI